MRWGKDVWLDVEPCTEETLVRTSYRVVKSFVVRRVKDDEKVGQKIFEKVLPYGDVKDSDRPQESGEQVRSTG